MNITLSFNADQPQELLDALCQFSSLVGGPKPANAPAAAPAPVAEEKKKSKTITRTETSAGNTLVTATDKGEGDGADSATGKVTLEEVRKMVTDKVQKDEKKRDGIKQLLKSYDVPNVTELDAKHYPEFVEKLKAI